MAWSHQHKNTLTQRHAIAGHFNVGTRHGVSLQHHTGSSVGTRHGVSLHHYQDYW